MKRFIAFLCVLVMVCSIAVVTLAACIHANHYFVYSNIVRTYTETIWKICPNGYAMHPHTRNYTVIEQVYYCPDCHTTQSKYVTQCVETCSRR